MVKAIFLDRDGVINKDLGYVYKEEDFIFNEDIFDVLKRLQDEGYILIIVTNQSGVGRGYYKDEDVKRLNNFVLSEFEKKSVTISKIYYCPHLPGKDCECRKPNPGMLIQAQREFDIDMENSWMIGDKPSDMEAGFNARVKNLILFNETKSKAKYNIKSLSDIIDIICLKKGVDV